METNDFDYILNLFQEEEKSMVSENKQVFEHLFCNDSNRLNLKECVGLLRVAFQDLEVRKGFLEMCSLLEELKYVDTTQVYTMLEKTNIKDFVKFVKEFRRLPNKYLVELSGKTGDKKLTPMIGIAGVISTFENKNSIIVRFRDNTCKIGKTHEEQWQNLIKTNTLGGALRHAERDLHQKQWSETVNNLFGIKADEIQNKIEEDYKGAHGIKALDLARILTCSAQFFNVCFRGKGSGDFHGTDSTDYNIFSMLNSYLPKDKELELFSFFTPFLFERVSYQEIDDEFHEPKGEFKETDTSQLNALGKRITERVLKLFLPKDEYQVKNEYGEIKVVAKNNKYSMAKYYLEYFGKSEKGKPQRKEWTNFKDMMSKFCTNNFPAPKGLPDTEQEFREKLNKINYEDVLKSMDGMNISIDKNDFVDMLVGILYVHNEQIHGYVHDQDGKTAEDVKTGILKSLRATFALPDEFDEDGEVDPASVIFNYAPNYFKTKINGSIPGLPSTFAGYSSSDSEKKYSPLNYIQALFASALIVKKYYECDFQTRGIIAPNIRKLRNMFVADNDADYNLIYNEIQTKIKKNPSMKPQELFAMMICGGTNYTTKNTANKNERDDITNICDVAHDLMEYDLDTKERKQASQLIIVELPKNSKGKERGWYINESDGTLMLPLNVDRLYNPEKFKFESFDDTDNLNPFNGWQNYNGYNNQNLNNNVFVNQNNNLNPFNGAQNYNGYNNTNPNNNNNQQQMQDNDNQNKNNSEVENGYMPLDEAINQCMMEAGCQNDRNAEEIKEILKEYATKNNIDNVDEDKINCWSQIIKDSQGDTKTLKNVLDLGGTEAVVEQWMKLARDGFKNDENLKKTLEEYADKEKINSLDTDSEYNNFVRDCVCSYDGNVAVLRETLGLKKQEEKDENKDLDNDNHDEEQQRNNNSQVYLNNNERDGHSSDSSNQFNNQNVIENTNLQKNSNLSYNENYGDDGNNLNTDLLYDKKSQHNSRNDQDNNNGIRNIIEDNLHNDSQNFRNNSNNNNKLAENHGNEINDNIDKKNDIDSLTLYKKIKEGNHFCRDMCMLEASKYNSVKKYFTFLEKIKVLLYWIFSLSWILKRFVNYTTHVNSEKKKSITDQNKSDDKEKNSQNEEFSYQKTILRTNDLDTER